MKSPLPAHTSSRAIVRMALVGAGGAKAEIPARRDPARSSGGYVIRTDGRRRRGSRQPARRAPPLRHLHREPRAQPQLLRAPLPRRDACASCGWRRGSASRTLQREHASAQPGPQGPDALTLASPAQAHSWQKHHQIEATRPCQCHPRGLSSPADSGQERRGIAATGRCPGRAFLTARMKAPRGYADAHNDGDCASPNPPHARPTGNSRGLPAAPT